MTKTTRTGPERNSHDDPVVVDNGPFRLDLRGTKKQEAKERATTAVTERDFTFFRMLIIALIKNDDLQSLPEVHRLVRTPDVVFHLAHNSATATVTLRWARGSDPNEPLDNRLSVVVQGIELEMDSDGRLKAKQTHKDFRVVRITQGATTLWNQQPANRMFFSALIPEPEHH